MIKKIIKLTREYGIIKTSLYCSKKILLKYKIKKLRIAAEKNQKLYNLDFLNNFQTESKFFYNINFKKKIKEFYDKNLNLKDQILKDAEKILQHKFSFLSDKEYTLGESIPWTTDFKANFTWENKFYKDIKIVDLENTSDVKIPWELSRMQHFFTLGKAYWITDDIKYYNEFKKEILDWIDKNPIYYSVNWTCAMDVAIRSSNIIFAYFLFEDLIKEDKDFLDILNKSLYEHGVFIYDNLEKGIGLANNHYLSNLAGLIFIGIYFNDINKEVKKWLHFSIKELEKEMLIQNNEDGSNYESSTSYHKLVTELFFYPCLLLDKNGISFSNKYKERLEKLFIFMSRITKPNGKYPLIGDIDNGRFVILSNYYKWDIDKYLDLISVGGEYFNNKVGANSIENKFWLFGNENSHEEKLFDKSIAFEKGGYYILQNENIYCMIRAGELSMRGQGGHSHNDQLAIELNILGEDFFVDSGTGVYTANKNIRNLFRSTKMHNTVSIENLEQNNFEEDKLFEMQEESFARCIEFKETKFVGEHYGYLNKNGAIHRREIILKNNELEIIDNIGKEVGIFNLNLDFNVEIEEKKDKLILSKNRKKIVLDLKGSEYIIGDNLISKKYGQIKKSKRIEIKVNKKNKVIIKVGC